MKYVGIVNQNGTAAAAYSPAYVANVENDMLHDGNVVKYRTGFNSEAEALKWANEQ